MSAALKTGCLGEECRKVKKEVLVGMLLKAGFIAAGGTKHEKFRRGTATVMVPRHTEIGERLARKILKDAGIQGDSEK